MFDLIERPYCDDDNGGGGGGSGGRADSGLSPLEPEEEMIEPEDPEA